MLLGTTQWFKTVGSAFETVATPHDLGQGIKRQFLHL